MPDHHPRRTRALEFFALVALAVLATRIPFLGEMYGLDTDTPIVVNTARELAATGVYHTSRFPGYPVTEMVFTLVAFAGPWVLNGLTALASAVGAGFFALIVRRLGGRDAALAALALAAVPAVYIDSTSTMDYVWALAFLIASLYFSLGRRAVVAGVLLGLATGTRITSVLYVVPLAMLLVDRDDVRATLRRLGAFGGSAAVSWAIAFSPMFLAYGVNLDFLQRMAYARPLRSSLDMITLGVWGEVGVLGLAIGAVAALGAMVSKGPVLVETAEGAVPSRLATWVVGVAIGVGAFLIQPIETGFLVPYVPWLLLLLAALVPRRVFVTVCLLVIVSPFVGFSDPEPPRGPVLAAHAERGVWEDYAQAALAAVEPVPDGAVVIAGHFAEELEARSDRETWERLEFNRFISGVRLQEHIDAGSDLYYLSQAPEWHGVDPEDLDEVATRLEVEWPEDRELPQVRGVEVPDFTD